MELADHVRLNRLIKQYSQFITFPIKLYSPKKEAKQVSGQASAWPGPLRTLALLHQHMHICRDPRLGPHPPASQRSGLCQGSPALAACTECHTRLPATVPNVGV